MNKRTAERELARREAQERFTIESLCGPHVKQAAALRDLLENKLRRQAWMTARRAGKTTTAAFAMALFALANAAANIVYVGLTHDHARDVIYKEIFSPLVTEWQLRAKPVDSRREVTFLDTGAFVKFGGADNLRHVRTLLGTRLDLVVVDECQDQDGKVLEKLVTKILPPALGDGGRGRLLLMGTKPPSPRSFWYEVYKSGRFLTHNWSGRDNPFYANFETELSEFMAANGLTIDSELVQSDWLGNVDIFDTGATAFRYRIERNRYTPEMLPIPVDKVKPGKLLMAKPPVGVNRFAIGIDPGSGDRWAMALWGWADGALDVYQVAEWVAPQGSNIGDWDPCKAILDLWHDTYTPIVRTYRDAGSTKETLELFGAVMRRHVLKAANKSDRRAQVERMATFLGRGQMHVLGGSELEADLLLACWDPEALREHHYEWNDSVIHPDVADAARYGIQGYFETRRPEPKAILTPSEAMMRDVEEAHKKRFLLAAKKQPKPRDSQGLWKPYKGEWS